MADSMKIFIDADGCPVVDITVRIAKAKSIGCYIICDAVRLTEAELDSLTRFKPDGLIFDAQHFRSMMGSDFANITNIPDGLSYEVIQFNPYHNFLDRNPSSEEIDGMSAGNMAIRMLLDPERPKYKMLSPTYHPESSGCSNTNQLFFEVI